MSEPKKKTPAARPKLQTPTPKKRQPVKRKAEHSDAIRSVATPAPAPSPAKKQNAMLHGAIWVLVLGVTGYIALALATFDNRDPSLFFLRNIPNTGVVYNKAGLAGAYLADLAYASLGLSAWWLVAGGLVWLFRHMRSQDEAHSKVLFGIGLAIILFFMPVVERLLWEDDLSFMLQDDAGGWVGKNTTDVFLMYLGRGGSLFVLGVVLVAGFKLMVQFSYRELGGELWKKIKEIRDYILERHSDNSEGDTIAPKAAEIKQPWLKRVSGSLKREKNTENVDKTDKPVAKSTEQSSDKPVEKKEQKEPKPTGSLKKLVGKATEKITPKKKAKPTKSNAVATSDVAVDGLVGQGEQPSSGVASSVLERELAKLAQAQEYVLPSVNLLTENQDEQEVITQEMLMPMSELIVEKLAEFGIKVEIVNAFRGPVITRFEIRPSKGIKGSQITNLAKDLARSMAVESVRVVETIQGKDTMGIELPNEVRRNVLLRDIVGHKIFHESESKLTVSLGANIVGGATIADLAKMPHVLVGGMTGSGKSVGVNAMIMSLLFKAKPDEVRLIMIDPKMLELSVYEGIPHLLCPVITDMREAGNALNWCVAEMEKRYRLLSHVGVRNLASYNAKVQAAIDSGEPISNPFSLNRDEPEPLQVLPQIVIVIDELADLMMTEKKAVEVQITRIAQKSRAAGMHMIIATQRPSVDVITGLIKANVPTRMAFTVHSKIDSRTILDEMGAEDLLKNGDLLFMSPGNATPTRLQSPFVSDEEVHDVVAFIKAQGEPNYVEGLLTGEAVLENQQFLPPDMLGKVPSDKDELFDSAVDFVLESRKTSISSLQRALRIGYNRAANIMQQMEDEGIVSSVESNGTRRILRAKE